MAADPNERRKNIIAKQTAPRVLALITTYYPLVLRAKILTCCKRQVWGNYKTCCRDALCPTCNPRESKVIANAQYAIFQAFTPPGRAVRLAHDVYTLPPMLRRLVLTQEGYRAWRDATRATIRALHGEHAGGVMNLHPMGDRNITKFHPHWDCVINGYTPTPPGALPVQARRFTFDEGRQTYRRELCKAFHLTPTDAPREVDAWWDRKESTSPASSVRAYHTGAKKTRAIVNYSARYVYRPDQAFRVDAAQDWAYRVKDNVVAFEGQQVISNLLAQRAWQKGKIRRCWFGYLKGKHRANARATFHPEGGATA